MTTCKICGEHTMIPDDLEDTGICNLCAQKLAQNLVPKLAAQIAAMRALLLEYRDKANCGEYAVNQNWTEAVDRVTKV